MACHSRSFGYTKSKIQSFSKLSIYPLLYPLVTGIILIAVFLYIIPAKAQVIETTEPATDTEVPILPATDTTDAPPTDSLEEISVGGGFVPDPTAGITNEQTPEQQATDAAAVADAQVDDNITNEDLDVGQARILQDNPLYGFKRFGRGLRKVFTFDKTKKIQLEIRYANQELADAQQLVDTKGEDANAIANVVEAVEKAEESLANVNAEAESLVSDGSAVNTRVIQNILDKQIKHQKVFEHIEEKILERAPEQVVAGVIERIQNARDRSATHAGEAVGRIERDPEILREHFDQALQQQRGSQFKELRNLEVLKRIQEHVPEHAREVIGEIEQRAIDRFKIRIDELPQSDRANRFERYTKHMGGDETRHLEIFDRLKNDPNLSTEIAGKIEIAKDQAAKKFKQRIEEFDTHYGDEAIAERMRARAFNRFEKGEHGPGVAQLRALEEIRQRVEFDNEKIKKEFEAEHEASITKFKDTFTDEGSIGQAERFARLSKKMAENPDPTTFRLLQELEKEVRSDPKKAKFLEQIESGAKSKFAQQAQEHGQEFFDRIISSNPQDIEIFKNLQKDFQKNPEQFFGNGPGFGPPGVRPDGFAPTDFGPDGFDPNGFGPTGFGPNDFIGGPPPGFAGVFDKLIDSHTSGLKDHLQGIKDPALFEDFQKKFQQGPAGLAQEIGRRQGGFEDLFKDKFRSINESAVERNGEDPERKKLDEERRKFEEEFRVRIQAAGEDREAITKIENEQRSRQGEFENKSTDLKQRMFQERLKSNPFCDERCRAEESSHFNDLIKMQQNRMEEMYRGPGGPDFGPQGFGPSGQQGGPQGFGPNQEQYRPQQPQQRAFTDESGVPIPDHMIDEFLKKKGMERDPRTGQTKQIQQAPKSQQPSGRVVDGVSVPNHIPDHQIQNFVNQRKAEERAKVNIGKEFDPGGVMFRDGERPKPTPTPAPADTTTKPGTQPIPTSGVTRPNTTQPRITDPNRIDTTRPPAGINIPKTEDIQRQINQFQDQNRQPDAIHRDQPRSGGSFTPPTGIQQPQPSSGGSFTPPSNGTFDPPPGSSFGPPPGFSPQSAPPTFQSKTFDILSSFFGLANVFASVGF
jgi:hypothetical protein